MGIQAQCIGESKLCWNRQRWGGGLSKVGLCGLGPSAGVCVCACACVRACECMCVYCIYVSVCDVSDGQRTKYCKQK